MATWSEVSQHLRDTYELSSDDAESVTMIYEWKDEERSQGLIVSTYNDGEAAWLSIVSGVCKEDQLKSKTAVKRNAELTVGALILSDGEYMLSYGVPLALLDDMDLLDYLLGAVAAQADSLESELAGSDDN